MQLHIMMMIILLQMSGEQKLETLGMSPLVAAQAVFNVLNELAARKLEVC